MMVSGPSAALIAALADPAAPVERQLEVARQLKNVLIGQDLRKEVAVRHGLVAPLTEILATATKAYGKREHAPASSAASAPRHHHHHPHLHQQEPALPPEDDLRLQAALILGSLAAGGQPFLRPLCAANVPRVLVQVLAADLAPTQTTAVLQALATLASAWAYAEEPAPVPGYDFWAAIFNAASLETFGALLRQEPQQQQQQPQQQSAAAPATGPATRARSPTQLHVQLIASIIASTADDPRCPRSVRALLAQHGLIDTLASLLVSYSVAAQHVAWPSTSQQRLPAAPPRAVVPSILAALAAIIAESNYRAHCFILSPSVRELFVSLGVDERQSFGPAKGFHNGRTALLPPIWVPSSTSVTRNPRHPSTNFPALQILQGSTRNGSASTPTSYDILLLGASDIEHSNAVCGWLLLLARAFTAPSARLAALRLLALTLSALESDPIGPADHTEHSKGMRERERQMILLAIPLAVHLLQAAAEAPRSEDVLAQRAAQADKTRACETLAALVQGSPALQVAAVENSAIKFLCPLLRKTFDGVALAKPMWAARRAAAAAGDPDTPETCRLGAPGLPAEILAAMRARRGALAALAALAAHKDLHRQAIIDAGVVGCIIDALKPFAAASLAEHGAGRALLAPREGNTTAVLVAACRAAQALSRSVSVLRTSLVDGGIVGPLVALLRHPDVAVQVAATDVCCNLAMTFSPMRAELAAGGGGSDEAGAQGGGAGAFVRILAEHARSSHAELRLSSLWALKHFVQDCPREVKIATFEELGSGWLVAVLQGERSPAGGGGGRARQGSGALLLPANGQNGGGVSVGGLSAPNAAGEQVDLLNPSSGGFGMGMGMEVDEVAGGHGGDERMEEDDEDEEDEGHHEEEEEEDDDDDVDLDEDEDGEVRYDEASSTHYQDSHLRSTLRASAAASAAAAAASSSSSSHHRHSSSFNSRRYLTSMRDLEQSTEYATRRDSAAIQVQALDFLRNLINGDDAAALHDHIVAAIGSAQLYELLHAHLLPLPRHQTAGKLVYRPTAVLLSTIHLLVHLANPSPRHRALLVAQKPLLQALLPHFAHADARVRVVAVWVVNSMTWTEDESDRAEAKNRIFALRALGFEAAVQKLQEDPSLDVRERVKTALRQFERL